MIGDSSWLEKLKAGDPVVVYSGGWSETRVVRPVERVTPTQIKVLGRTFRRRSGSEVGEGLHRWSLGEATPEICAEIADGERRRVLIRRIEAVKLKDIPTDRLAAAASALDGAP